MWGKRLGQPVWKLWGLDLTRIPMSDYTIGIDSFTKEKHFAGSIRRNELWQKICAAPIRMQTDLDE